MAATFRKEKIEKFAALLKFRKVFHGKEMREIQRRGDIKMEAHMQGMYMAYSEMYEMLIKEFGIEDPDKSPQN